MSIACRHTYDPTRPFGPWLAAIASRRSIDSLRRRLKIARHETGELEQAELHQYETFAAVAPNNDMEAVRLLRGGARKPPCCASAAAAAWPSKR